ncbi:hypothetical protein AB0E96_27160 [Kitasatospora sp. NPDC036755]|uniref:hypothetical protein n=1 Tax=Kitasatospora sp. NPDC036755 TaxID=3154600 RepID=UPI0033E1E618
MVMGIGDKFQDKAQQLEDEAKSRLGGQQKPQQGDDAQQKASEAQQQAQQQARQQGQQNQDDIEGRQ